MTQNMTAGQNLSVRRAHGVAATRAVDSDGSRERSEYGGFAGGGVGVCRRASRPRLAARAALARVFRNLIMEVMAMVPAAVVVVVVMVAVLVVLVVVVVVVVVVMVVAN